ncbi:MAG: Ribonucleases P/MRP protein subunit pop1 [Marteilia pararefringens]
MRYKSSQLHNMPWHMRRRAASKFFNRVPIKLRRFWPSNCRKINKNYSKNIIKQHALRFKKLRNRWMNRVNSPVLKPNILHTHIWHAKRFHMTKLWNWILPKDPTTKCLKQTQRMLETGVLIEDKSYISYLKIRFTNLSVIKRFCEAFSLKDCGQCLWKPNFRESQKLGRSLFYDTKGNLIGPFEFLWATEDSVDMVNLNHSSLIIFTHPATHCDMLNSLIDIADRIEFKNCIMIQNIENSFGQFVIYGRDSVNILNEVINASKLATIRKNGSIIELNKLSKSSELINGIVDVVDLKCYEDGLFEEISLNSDFDLKFSKHSSNLGNKDSVETSIQNAHKMENNLNFFKNCTNIETSDRISLLIVAFNLYSNTSPARNQLCGFKIIFPKSFTMTLWKQFIYRGAKAVGLAVEDLIAATNATIANNAVLNSSLYPDTDFGDTLERNYTETKHRKMMKRPLYQRQFMQSKINWNLESQDDSLPEDTNRMPKILRNIKILFEIHRCKSQMRESKRKSFEYTELIEKYQNHFIPVRIKLVNANSRGNISKYDEIFSRAERIGEKQIPPKKIGIVLLDSYINKKMSKNIAIGFISAQFVIGKFYGSHCRQKKPSSSNLYVQVESKANGILYECDFDILI